MAELPGAQGDPALSIRSYVLRQGRITKAQQRAWQMLAGRYLLSAEAPPPGGWGRVFAQEAPLVVEIGSGYGEATAQLAAVHPRVNYLAMEVHAPGIGALMLRLEQAEVHNVRIVHADALRAIPQMLAAQSVARFNVFFPDPWHKKRHHKRRLLRPAVVQLLAEKLVRGGGVHVVTDCPSYAESAAEVLAAHGGLAAAAAPPRAVTGYERRAAAAGRRVWEVYYEVG